MAIPRDTLSEVHQNLRRCSRFGSGDQHSSLEYRCAALDHGIADPTATYPSRRIDSMSKVTVDVTFSFQARRQNCTRDFDVDRDLGRDGLDFLASHIFRECHMQVLYRKYRRELSN